MKDTPIIIWRSVIGSLGLGIYIEPEIPFRFAQETHTSESDPWEFHEIFCSYTLEVEAPIFFLVGWFRSFTIFANKDLSSSKRNHRFLNMVATTSRVNV